MRQLQIAMWVIALGVPLVVSACLEKTDPSKKIERGDTKEEISEEVAPSLGAVGISEAEDVYNQFYNIMKYPMETRIDALKTKADAKLIPYSGSWYKEVQGGTNRAQALTKYDQVNKTAAAAWERNTVSGHGRLPSDPNADWAGHCNGWSASASKLAEPPRSVTRNGVTFSVADIKALLAEIHMSVNFVVLSGTRCRSKTPATNPATRPDKEHMSECEDSNPGTLHLALTNTIGGRDAIPVIMDKSISDQVWNYPVYKYECLNCTNGKWRELRSSAEALAIMGVTGVSGYPFNRYARKWYDVQIQITYADGYEDEVVARPKFAVDRLRYILEVDGEGKIVGGEWAAENRNVHPDMVWLALDPVRGSGDRSFANPHVDPEFVMQLWRDSWKAAGIVGVYEGKSLPAWDYAWGKFADFEIYVDGSASGTVFLGKPTVFEMKLTTSRYEGGDAEIILNGTSVRRSTLSKSPVKFDMTPSAGMNRLTIIVEKASTKNTFDTRFYVIP